MNAFRWIVPAVVALATAVAAPACESSGELPDAQHVQNPRCVYYRAEVRRRYPGYDHLVHLQNACQTRAVCDVSSDVAPKPVRVQLAPAEQKTVTLSRNSPAKTFVPKVSCEVARAE